MDRSRSDPARLAAPSLGRRLAAEAVGSALLLATIVGSGIMAERLAGGNVALALLANTLATGAGLVALILTFGGVSGAHFNPAITICQASQGGLPWRAVPPYVAAQLGGAFAGVALAHLMFGAPIFSTSHHVRAGIGQLAGELVATFGLVSVIRGCAGSRPAATPFAVAAYITAAYWFTSSTSFANPAVTLARAATDSFAGIRPADAPGFILAQALGATSATLFFRWLTPHLPAAAAPIIAAPAEEDAVNIVIFACVHNAGRSQMAAAWFNQLADPAQARAVSAGTAPGPRVHPQVEAAMREVGVDSSGAKPQLLTAALAAGARLLVTMGCGEACPHVPGLEREDWPLEDPKDQPLERVRAIRDDVRARVLALVEHEGWGR